MELMSHQKDGVEFLRRAGGRVLVADEAGLGKTAMVLTYLREEKLKAVVVTTKSFLYGWRAEAKTWWPEAGICIVESSRDSVDVEADLVLVTYDTLWRSTMLSTHQGTAVVLDESHKIANQDAKRSEAARTLVATRKQVICLSGTPQPNGQPQQLWHQLLCVFPAFFPWRRFAEKFCDAKRVWTPWANRGRGGFEWDTTGASNLEELRDVMAPRYLRRTKALLNLPPLTTEWLPVPVRLYREADESWKTFEGRLAAEKAPFAERIVEDVVDAGRKALVFTQSTAVRDLIAARQGTRAVVISADMDAERRASIVQQFQTDPAIEVLVATPQICAEGITLTAADTVVFVDVPWSPGAIEQAQSRAYRKGQEKPVHVYYLQSDTYYDEAVRAAIERKQEVTERLLDDGEK